MVGKSIIKFIVIWLSFMAIFLAHAVYRDIKINKLFNYLSIPENIQYEAKYERKEKTIIEYKFTFSATDNYLGAVLIPLKNLQRNDGDVTFKIKEEGSDQWFHINTYDYNFFRKLNNYIFGFPVIKDSQNVKYAVSLTFVSKSDDELIELFDKNSQYSLMAKYVFPRSFVLRNPSQIFTILKFRSLASAREVNYTRLFSAILFLNIVVLYLSNNTLWGIREFKFGNLLSFVQKALKPGYSSVFLGVALLLAIAIPPLILFNRFSLAERAANYIWIFLSLGLVWFFVFAFLLRALERILKILGKLYSKYKNLLFCLYPQRSLVIILLMFVLVAGLKRTYLLGGDDSRLFFLYPHEFLANFSSKIVSEVSISNVGLFIPPASTAALTVTMIMLKEILGTLNLQSILYTANMVGGTVFFYLLISYLRPVKEKYGKLIKLLTSFLYVFSIFNIYTLYNSKLLAIFLISLFPLTLYLIIKAVVEKKVYLIIVSALIFSVFCLPTIAAPWYFSTLVAILPLLIVILKNYKLRTVKYFLILIFSFLLLNFHWLVYLPSMGSGENGVKIHEGGFTSASYRKQNTEGIEVVSKINSVFYPLMNLYHQKIQEDFNWAYYSIFKDWYIKILPFNLIFIAVILLAGISINPSRRKPPFFVSASLSFLLAVYFFTVNITKWGIGIFTWMNNYIPGFVMFRNMYDKFAFSVSFTFALLLYLSLTILIKKTKHESFKNYLLYGLVIVAIINAKPFLLGEFGSKPLWTTASTYSETTALNEDFLEMMEYIKDNSGLGKYLSLPLTMGNAFPVQDVKKPNYYYNGVSPVLILSGKNDFSGILSFGSYREEVLTSIREKDYEHFGEILRQFNIRYAIVNHTISSDLQNSFVYADGFYFLQDEEFMKNILGEKIKDFGEKYSLYKINDEYQGEKIFLSADKDDVFHDTRPVSYTKVASHEYDIVLDGINERFDYLIFLDPYLEGWKLYSDNGEELNLVHLNVLGYANSWYLEPETIKNSVLRLNEQEPKKYLKLYYAPYDYYWYSIAVSILTYVILLTYTTVSLIRERRRQK